METSPAELSAETRAACTMDGSDPLPFPFLLDPRFSFFDVTLSVAGSRIAKEWPCYNARLMRIKSSRLLALPLLGVLTISLAAQQAPSTQKPRPEDTEVWEPVPKIVAPGTSTWSAPADAIVLFDGKDLSKWAQRGANGESIEPKWPVHDGYFETGAKSGSMFTRDSFGDVQLHIEWATPSVVSGTSQGRGNSGVILMGRYEVQVLDVYNNRTYSDGGAGSLYGQWPPLVSAPRPPGEWQAYDIIFEAPRFEGDKLVTPAFATVIWNGVLVQHRRELVGATAHRTEPKYTPHPAELPLTLQDHSNPVRFRNVWIRRLK